MRKRGEVVYTRDETVETAVKAVQWKKATAKTNSKGKLILSAENIVVRQKNEQGGEQARWARSLEDENEQPDSQSTAAKCARDNDNNSSPEDLKPVNLKSNSLKPSIQSTLKYTKTFKNMSFFPQEDRSLNSFYEPEKAVVPSLRGTKEEEDEEVDISPDSSVCKEEERSVEIEIYTKWNDNNILLQEMTLQWKERLQLTRIVDILKVVEFLLEKPEHLLLFADHLIKVQIQLTDHTIRYINFFWILAELSAITCESELKTQMKVWFEMEIEGEDITHFPLNKILSTEELRYFPKKLSDLITKFFMTLAVRNELNATLLAKKFDELLQRSGSKPGNFREIENISLEAVKILFLAQIREDLLAMKKAA